MQAFPERWKVSAPELIAETFSSRIWKVARDDGSVAIVKDLKPFDDVADELRGEHYLGWRRGEGAVLLLGRDGNRMLLEYAGDRAALAASRRAWRRCGHRDRGRCDGKIAVAVQAHASARPAAIAGAVCQLVQGGQCRPGRRTSQPLCPRRRHRRAVACRSA
ncbi:hypothetical protein MPLA_230056 [Mesorhizobium sp. ORS 3359]|nr:hypothetical protein MPLA_230056 [Mesorhizobium sp. ORS 3359]